MSELEEDLHSRHDSLKRVRNVMVEVNPLKQLQAETTAELDAMLPSILDRAFKGKLL